MRIFGFKEIKCLYDSQVKNSPVDMSFSKEFGATTLIPRLLIVFFKRKKKKRKPKIHYGRS